MAPKITKLTPAQEAEFVTFRDAQRAIGTRTGHDAECAEIGRAAVLDAYREIGVEAPALVLWAQSPLQAVLMHWALSRMLERAGEAAPSGVDLSSRGALRGQLWGQLWGQLEGQLWDQLWDQLRGQLWGQLGGQLWDQLWDQLRGQLWGQLGGQLEGQLRGQLGGQLRGQLRGQLWGQLWGQLEGQLWDQLRGQLGGQLRGQLWDQLRGQLGGQLRGQLWGQLRGQLEDQLRGQLGGQLEDAWNQRWCWGQCESYWLAFYRFAISIGVRVTDEQDRRLHIWERLARAAYMVLSWRGVSILVQHPTIARFDDRQQLHAVDGPALAWGDGYAVYAVRGVRMSPERGAQMAAGALTARQILEEPNAEVRRVLVDVYNRGDSGRWVRDLDAKPIHSDVDPMGRPRRLYQIEQPGDEPYTLIEVVNSTPEFEGELAGKHKGYTFRVAPDLRPLPGRGAWHVDPQSQELTCQNAIASGYGYYGHEYHPVLET